MARTVTYRLPWPPSMNSYWGTRVVTTKGRPLAMTYLTKRAKEFRQEVSAIVGQQEPLEQRLAVNIELIAPTRRRFDVDNFCKGTIDALMHAGVFEDDSQIDRLIVSRLHVESPGACDVTITEMEG